MVGLSNQAPQEEAKMIYDASDDKVSPFLHESKTRSVNDKDDSEMLIKEHGFPSVSDDSTLKLFLGRKPMLIDVEKTSRKNYIRGLIAGLVVAIAIVAPFIFTAFVRALGFTTIGVTAGSVAARIMRAYGGVVAVGSLCAILQSVGAAGLGLVGKAITSIVGAVGANVILTTLIRRAQESKTTEQQSKC